MWKDAQQIIAAALEAAQPDTAVRTALRDMPSFSGRLILIAVGKAAWKMAHAAMGYCGEQVSDGIIITKYGHAGPPLPPLRIWEAGHPVPDSSTYAATEAAVQLVRSLHKNDLVLFLLSGGGSSLFEMPLLPPAELAVIYQQLLECGADIREINTIRKRFSAVKGGRFARLCAPADIFSVILSDIPGNPLDMIASGPTCADCSTSAQAVSIAEKYQLSLSPDAAALLKKETPKNVPNSICKIAGSGQILCRAACSAASALGYEPTLLTDSLDCEAQEAGRFFAAIARSHYHTGKPQAFISGGETVVHLPPDHGTGGRNQELAFAAASGIAGLPDVLLFSLGSDGTDGPTKAAGGWVDGDTVGRLNAFGITTDDILMRHDTYNALHAIRQLIFTGPTGTNVNDLTVLLLR